MANHMTIDMNEHGEGRVLRGGRETGYYFWIGETKVGTRRTTVYRVANSERFIKRFYVHNRAMAYLKKLTR